MKKFLATLLVVGTLLFTSTVDAAIEKYIGTGSATVSENETQDAAVKRATTSALKNAREQIGVYVRDYAQRNGFKLDDDEIETVTVGLLKLVDTKLENFSGNDGIQVRATVTVEVDTDNLQREIDNLSNTKPVEVETTKTYMSEASATMGDSETQEQTVNRAKSYAMKDIRYQANIDIRTFARTRKLELTNPEVDFVAAEVLKITDTQIDTSLVKYTIQVRVNVTAQINSADLARCIEEISRRRNA